MYLRLPARVSLEPFRFACYSPDMEKVPIEAELPAALAAQARVCRRRLRG